MPNEPSADFVSIPGSTAFTDSHGIRWQLGFDETTDPPTPIYVPALTWGSMKARFATWADVKATGATWGIAKGF